jgi:hypothetical protein
VCVHMHACFHIEKHTLGGGCMPAGLVQPAQNMGPHSRHPTAVCCELRSGAHTTTFTWCGGVLGTRHEGHWLQRPNQGHQQRRHSYAG